MSLLKIVRMGHPALRKVAQPFTVAEIKSTHTKQLVRDMKATLKHVKGLGLAAPQVGISKQLLIVEVPGDISNDIEEIPETVAFNPKLEFLLTHETIPMWESCLSVPDLVGKVERFNNTIMHYVDEEGRNRKMACTGYLSGVLQHESDHLLGKIFIDRMKDMKHLYFTAEWEKYSTDSQDICTSGTVKIV